MFQRTVEKDVLACRVESVPCLLRGSEPASARDTLHCHRSRGRSGASPDNRASHVDAAEADCTRKTPRPLSSTIAKVFVCGTLGNAWCSHPGATALPDGAVENGGMASGRLAIAGGPAAAAAAQTRNLRRHLPAAYLFASDQVG